MIHPADSASPSGSAAVRTCLAAGAGAASGHSVGLKLQLSPGPVSAAVCSVVAEVAQSVAGTLPPASCVLLFPPYEFQSLSSGLLCSVEVTGFASAVAAEPSAPLSGLL